MTGNSHTLDPTTETATLESAAKSPRYLSLDIWRGVACLAVMIYHLAGDTLFIDGLPPIVNKLFSFGWVGVPMFFVISGYCIAATADREKNKPIPAKRFLIRRFYRIFPPFWIVMIFCGIVTMLGLEGAGMRNPLKLSFTHWIGNPTLTETWLGRILERDVAFVLMPSWTLCYEVQFYLVCGLALCCFPKRIFASLLGVSIVVVPISLISWYTNGQAHGFFFDGLWLEFSIGLLVYYLLSYSTKHGVLLAVSILVTSLVIIILLRVISPPDIVAGSSRRRFFDELACSILFGMLILVLAHWDHALASSWLMKPLMFCGTICYSLYLTHIPTMCLMRKFAHIPMADKSLMHWMDAVFSLVVTIVVGALFYCLVERRFMNSPFSFAKAMLPPKPESYVSERLGL